MTVEDDERIRLRDHQLDYLRAELLRLVRERDEMIYSASWLLFDPMRRAEAALVRKISALYRRFAPRQAPVVVAPVCAPVAAVRRDLAPPRRLLVDATATIKHDAGTGIQRVVKKVVAALYRGEAYELPALAVRAQNGHLHSAHAWAATLTGGAPRAPDAKIEIEPGDRLLLLSDSWNAFDELAPLFAKIRAQGGELISCIFDLIPELYPHSCHAITPALYDAWLRKALLESDAFLAISSTVADELAEFVLARGLAHRPGLKIGWFHCGSELAAPQNPASREKPAAAVSGSAPVFLCVGTIEPRKGQRVVLRAFDRLWREGADAKLVVVGRRGWFDEAVSAELREHGELGKRLFWFDDASDADLDYLYSRATGLVFASFAEGFGLPIVEAARRGVAVFCSDIPVFREVGRDGAIYFRVNDSDALASKLSAFLSGELAVDPKKILRASWDDAARQIVSVVAREGWTRVLD